MAVTDAPSVPMIDGIPLTPKPLDFVSIPKFDNFADERRHRKERLAGARLRHQSHQGPLRQNAARDEAGNLFRRFHELRRQHDQAAHRRPQPNARRSSLAFPVFFPVFFAVFC